MTSKLKSPKDSERLKDEIQNAIHKELIYVDSADEIRLQIKGVLRKEDRRVSLFCNVATGGTRAGYLDSSDRPKTTMMVGVNDYQRFVVEATGQDKRPFADVAVDPKLVFDKLRTPFKTFQDGHEKVYLVGGIVWVMANYQHPGDRGKYVKLTARDITWFEKAMRSSPNPLADFVAPAGLPPALATEMKLEIQKMKDVFPPQKLVAGAKVLKTLSEELDFVHRKEMWFDRDAEIEWFLEYVAEKVPRKD